MSDQNDNLLNGQRANNDAAKASIIKRPENVGLISNKFKKVKFVLKSKLRIRWRYSARDCRVVGSNLRPIL